jgi:hypothetical protein
LFRKAKGPAFLQDLSPDLDGLPKGRHVNVSGRFLNRLFDGLPKGSHVDLIIEAKEVHEAVKMCADNTIYCQLESWRRLMDMWKTRGSAKTIGEF